MIILWCILSNFKNFLFKVYTAKISLNPLDSTSNSIIRNLTREINIVAKLNHPSVLKFIGYSPLDFKKESFPTIITEYACNGSLNKVIHQIYGIIQ